MVRAKKESKRRAPGEGGLFKRGDGMWTAVIDVPTTDGRRRQKRVYSKDYNTAVDKLRKLRADIDKGILPATTTTTVGRWITHWLETIKRPHVRPNTYDFYEEAVRLHIVPHIGKRRLDRLTAEHVRGMLRAIKTSRNKQRAYQTLNLALKDAIVEGMLARNVCEAVRKPEHLAAERGAFTFDDAKKVIRAGIDLEESRDETSPEPRLATRWAAAFLTGARKAELLGLTWDRVDLEHGLFDFAWQLQQLKKVHGCPVKDDKPTCGRQRPSYCPQAHWDFEDGFEYRECYKSLVWSRPKTKKGTRIVPIVAPLLEMLKRHAGHGGPNPRNLVWHFPDGRPLSPTDDHERWTEVLKLAEVPHVELHAARHTTATMLQSMGVDEDTRMAIMGQSSAAAQRMYVHVDQAQSRAALDKIANLLAPAPKDGP
jgi:integrase